MIDLTERQIVLWKLKLKGLSPSEIAVNLNISRQAVHRALKSIESKVYKALIGVAKANRIEIREINVEKGYLIGWSPEFRCDVFVTFSASNGVQVWYRHKGNCRNCKMRDECIRILMREAEERGLNIEANEPCVMAEELFRKLRG
jgi:IS30 family transposase